MVKEKYVSPELGLEAFNCPKCGVYSHQRWHVICEESLNNSLFITKLEEEIKNFVKQGIDIHTTANVKHKYITSLSRCFHCNGVSLWVENKLIYPNSTLVELPNFDMPAEIQALYNEASSIVNLSAKSAAALLRLALEKLLIHVGAKPGSIDNMIKSLIEKDVISASGTVRKALDSLRLIGNAGVHPTGINLDEDPKAAMALFKVINFVVEKLITDVKEMEEIYALVPQEKRESLDIRRNK
ncbi:DUF4145 domain-containing protein [Robertmurraya sp. GLU-23]